MEGALRRWPWLQRRLDRAWDTYDDLSDVQRVAFAGTAALLLAACALYLLGVASLLALQRHTPTVAAEESVAADGAAAAPTEVNPISPLLAERTPTPSPTATTRPATALPREVTPAPTVRPIAGLTPATQPARGLPGGTLATPTRGIR
jgi:hypothetical protein